MACFVNINNKRQNLKEAATASELASKHQKLELTDQDVTGQDIVVDPDKPIYLPLNNSNRTKLEEEEKGILLNETPCNSNSHFARQLSTLPSIQEETTQEDSVDIFAPSDAELDETLSKLADGQCGCTSKWIDENCIQRSIALWRPDHFIICGGCFWNQQNQMGHDCLMWELYEIDLEKRTREVLLNFDNLIELYEIYVDEHREVDDLTLLKNYECGLRSLLERKVTTLQEELLGKDKRAYDHYNLSIY